MRTLAIVVAAIVTLLIGAVVALPYLIDVNDYKSEITRRVAEATGRQLEIGGDIRFKLLPTPRLAVADLAIANPPGSASPDMARVKSLDVEIALVPLLTGQILVRRIVLIEPVVELTRSADGRVNWRDRQDDDGATADPPEGGLDTVRLDQVVIEGASIIYRDDRAGVDERLDGLNAELSAASLAGPYRVAAFADWRGLPLALSAELGDFGAGRAAPVKLAVETRDTDARLELSGVVSAAEPARRLTGRAKLEGSRFAAFAAGLARAYGTNWTIRGSEGMAFEATAEIAVSAGALTLDKLALRVGETAVGGDLQLAFGPRPNLNLRLSASRLDLTPWLADAPATPVTQGGGGFVLPAGLTGAIELEAVAVTWPGGVARRARVAAQMADGAVVVSRATALLAGGSTVALSGRLVTPGGRPRFEGRLEAGSNNMRAMLDRLGVDTKAVSVDRLRKFHLVAGFRVTDEVAQVHEIDLRLDTSRITGAAAYALRRRPSFSIDLMVDRANLDAYIAKPRPAAASETTPPGNGPLPFARLGEFDSNTRLRIGRLVYQGQIAEDVELDLALFDGALTIRRAHLARVAGAAATLTGSVADLRGTPRFDLAARLAAVDFTGLLRRFDIALPGAGGLGGEITADLAGAPADATVALTATLGETALDVRGRVQNAMTVPRIDLTVTAQNQSLAALARRVDLPVAPLDGADGPLGVEAKLAGTAEALDFDVRLDLVGGEVTAAGSGGLTEAGLAYKLDLTARHPDALALAHGLGLDFRPASSAIGAFALKAAVEGSALTADLSGIEAGVGPLMLDGRLGLDFAGPRPQITARLGANDLAADLFLPAATAGLAASDGAGTALPRWSEVPFAFDYLQAVDADVELTAAAFAMRGYRVAEPELAFSLRDGRFAIERLAGRLFDGAVALSGSFETTPIPALDLQIALTGADWHQALIAVAGIDRLSGRFDLEGGFTAEGRNQREMVESLNGEARLAVRDGAVAGIDLPGLNAGLGGTGAAAELVATVLSGGQTALRTASGTWPIRNGVATTEDSVARLDGAGATLGGRIELPAWRMKLSAALQPTEPPGVPAFGIDFTGPVDDPARRLRTRDLEAFIARRAEARQAAERRAAEAATKAETKPPAVAEDMLKNLDQDAAEGLLKALSGRRN